MLLDDLANILVRDHGNAAIAQRRHSVVEMLCGGDPDRLRRLDVRFSAPVYPGEEITTHVWIDGRGQASFRCTVEARGKVVIDNGAAEFDVA